jgi:hypothetical protein
MSGIKLDIKSRLNKKNLENLALETQKSDSTAIALQEQARLDSIARADSIKLETLKHLKTAQTLQDLEKLDSQFVEGQPMSSVYLNPEYQTQSEDAIYSLLEDMIVHEAQTNISDDYQAFNLLRQELINIHSPYQHVVYDPAIGGQAGSDFGPDLMDISTNPNLITIKEEGFKPINRWFQGANNIDKIWPSDTKKFKEPSKWESNVEDPLGFNISTYLEEGPYYKTEDHDFRSATVARMVASDQEIRDLILGRADLNEKTEKWEVSGGLVSLIDSYNISGESETWSWMKESFGFRSNTLKIIDIALKAKKMGRNYFTDPGGWMTEKGAFEWFGPTSYNVSGISMEMEQRLSAYPVEQQNIIRQSLQEAVNLIYSKGSKIEEHANELVNKFESYQAQFSGKRGLSPRLDGPSQNKDLIAAEEYKRDLDGSIKAYKAISGVDFNVHEALNNISIKHLEEELEKLPDSERTDAIDQYLINLTQVGGQ